MILGRGGGRHGRRDTCGRAGSGCGSEVGLGRGECWRPRTHREWAA
uniref:Uncharacterized protein n=1 Tax=Arundo donax TaxID=35708 RepID=A0A0A9BNL6_ARUDO